MDAATPAPAATAAAVEKVEGAQPSQSAEKSSASTTTAALSKWPWGATLLIAILLLAGLFAFQTLLWIYVQGAKESVEAEDFDQLKAIADNIQTIVMLLVGAIFGVGATQGVAAGAAKAAEENKKVAENATATANDNAAAATTNLERSRSFESATSDLAEAIVRYRETRKEDDSRFIRHIQAGARVTDPIAWDDSDVQSHDPDLDLMADNAERILERLKSNPS